MDKDLAAIIFGGIFFQNVFVFLIIKYIIIIIYYHYFSCFNCETMYVLESCLNINISLCDAKVQKVPESCIATENRLPMIPALIANVLNYNLIQIFICLQGSFPSREASFLSCRLRCIIDMSWNMETRTNSGGPYLQGCEDGKERPYQYLTTGKTRKNEGFRTRKVNERPPCDREWIMSPSLAAH